MPQLSPLMTKGKLLKWYAKEGEAIKAYELIIDMIPDKLTGEGAEIQPVMEIELQEEMYIAKCFCSEGQEIEGGTPLAILCELEEDIILAKELKVD